MLPHACNAGKIFEGPGRRFITFPLADDLLMFIHLDVPL
jgi:hypothetical protein